MIKGMKLGWLIGLMALCMVSRANTNLGLEYYQNGDMERAHAEFLGAAQIGDYLAQRNLGAMYIHGQYVEADLVQAYSWLALAAQDPGVAQQGMHEKVLKAIPADRQADAMAAHEALLAQYGDEALREKMQPNLTAEGGVTRSFRPIKTIAPKYPRSAAQRGIQGWAEVMFTIEKDGTTSDHRPYSKTSDLLVEPALEAARKFQFYPTLVDEKPVTVHGVTYRFIFSFDDEEARDYVSDKVIERMKELKEAAVSGTAEDKFSFGYMLATTRTFTGGLYYKENANDWYLAAANEDYDIAGFFLGRNILYGDHCEADPYKSHLWLARSAANGVSDSQYLLAMELLSGARFEKDEQKALYWLEQAGELIVAAKLRHAWVLATHPDETLRDGKKAEHYWKGVDSSYVDKQRLYQTAAAIAAEQGDFKEAISWQKKAIKDARKLDLPLNTVNAQMAAYQAREPWREL